jgi:two-component system, cell cycle sensor histidine kinase PleC
MLMFCLIVAYQGTNAYKRALEEGEERSVRLAHILAEHVELTFLGVDLSLRRAIERQYFNALFGNNLPKYTEQNFKIWLNETPQMVALVMINENGKVEVSAHKKNYGAWLEDYQSSMGKELFDRMRETDDTEVFIGKHITFNQDSLIIMSRRYNKLNGEFGGIVLAAMDPSYFVNFYNSISTSDHRYMAILLSQQTTLATGPSEDKVNDEMAREFVASQPFASDSSHSTRIKNDDVHKIMAMKTLANMPIAVSVVLDSDDFLGAWRQSRLKDIGFLALFTIFGSILSFFAVVMARQIMRVEESEGAAILASQAKSEFLANMSHELRTPLNAIIGFSEMINSGYFGPLSAKQKERIHDIHLCGSHLLQLITDILEFSKGDAGKLELIEEKVDLGELIDEATRIMSGKIRTKGIALMVAVEPNLPLLWGDKRKIRQVLINLLSNSFKFTPEQGTITVSARVDQYNNIALVVADSGIGIAEDDIPKALSVFGQVHRTKSHEGTGLGLPLCKMYAELHDGKLVLTSKIGQGTNVKILFPHQRALPGRAALPSTATH